MAKKKSKGLYTKLPFESKAKFKRTSQSPKRPKKSSMNKNKKRSYKPKNRGGR